MISLGSILSANRTLPNIKSRKPISCWYLLIAMLLHSWMTKATLLAKCLPILTTQLNTSLSTKKIRTLNSPFTATIQKKKKLSSLSPHLRLLENVSKISMTWCSKTKNTKAALPLFPAVCSIYPSSVANPPPKNIEASSTWLGLCFWCLTSATSWTTFTSMG